MNYSWTPTLWLLSANFFLLRPHYFCQERDGTLDVEVIIPPLRFWTNFPYNLYCKPLWYSNGAGTAQNQKRKTVRLQVANERVPKMQLLTSTMGAWTHTSDIFCNQTVRCIPVPKNQLVQWYLQNFSSTFPYFNNNCWKSGRQHRLWGMQLHTYGGLAIARWLEHRTCDQKGTGLTLTLWVPAQAAGEFSSPGSAFCVDSYFVSVPPPLLVQ